MFSSLHPVGWHMTLICPITDDVDLIKVMSARLIHCKATLFRIIIYYFAGKYFKAIKTSHSSLNFLYILLYISILVMESLFYSMTYNPLWLLF